MGRNGCRRESTGVAPHIKQLRSSHEFALQFVDAVRKRAASHPNETFNQTGPVRPGPVLVRELPTCKRRPRANGQSIGQKFKGTRALANLLCPSPKPSQSSILRTWHNPILAKLFPVSPAPATMPHCLD